MERSTVSKLVLQQTAHHDQTKIQNFFTFHEGTPGFNTIIL
jgi:hypothetical protein